MSTAMPLGLMLAFEPVEAGVMVRPPTPPGAVLPDRRLGGRVVKVGVPVLLGGFGLFHGNWTGVAAWRRPPWRWGSARPSWPAWKTPAAPAPFPNPVYR